MGYGAGGGGMGRLGGKSVGPELAKRKVAESKVESLGGMADFSSRHRGAPVPAAPPPAPTSAAPRREEAEKDDGRAAHARLTATIAASSAAGLASPELLLAAVKARLASVDWTRAAGRPGQLGLRLTVDASGKVVAVYVVSGDAALAPVLKAKLVGLTSAAKATGKVATWTVTIRIEPR
jgi:hypothetical protein